MSEKLKPISDQIRQIITNSKNKPTVDQIMAKMGRLLAKKQCLSQQKPVSVEPRLWLGNYLYANDRQFLQQNNIKTVISCLQLPLSSVFPEIEYLKFSLKDDNDSRFEQMIPQFIDQLGQSKGNVLVHCFSGKSRSVSLILGYLMKRDKCSYEQVLQKLKVVYPLAFPNKYFAATLKKIQDKLINYKQVIEEDLLCHQPERTSKRQVQKQKQSLIQLEEEVKVQSHSKIEHSLIDLTDLSAGTIIQPQHLSQQQQIQAIFLMDGLSAPQEGENSAEIQISSEKKEQVTSSDKKQNLVSAAQQKPHEDLLDFVQPHKLQASKEEIIELTAKVQKKQDTLDNQIEEKHNFILKQPKRQINLEEEEETGRSHQNESKPENIQIEQLKGEEQLIQNADFSQQKKKRNKKKKK